MCLFQGWLSYSDLYETYQHAAIYHAELLNSPDSKESVLMHGRQRVTLSGGLIGEGSYGSVYKVSWPGGKQVRTRICSSGSDIASCSLVITWRMQAGHGGEGRGRTSSLSTTSQ
jgi:hypothetical protein